MAKGMGYNQATRQTLMAKINQELMYMATDVVQDDGQP
jgi:hypothetical protein